jgi:hypothetical protein
MTDDYWDDAALLRLDAVRVRSTGVLIGLAPCPGTEAFPSGHAPGRVSLAGDLDAVAAWGDRG